MCSAHSFADPRTGAHLRFEPVTNVEHHELLHVLWRLDGRLLVVARSERASPPHPPAVAASAAPAAAAADADESKKEGAAAAADGIPSSTARALTVAQFYHLFLYLLDNFSLLQQARSQLQRLRAPPSSSSSSASVADEDDARVCSICVSSSVELALPCLHAFCRDCIEEWIERDATCPLCRVKADASTDEVWVMDSGNDTALQEQIDTVSRFPFTYLQGKPEYITT